VRPRFAKRDAFLAVSVDRDAQAVEIPVLDAPLVEVLSCERQQTFDLRAERVVRVALRNAELTTARQSRASERQCQAVLSGLGRMTGQVVRRPLGMAKPRIATGFRLS
jgi:hypothetical protein